MTKEASPARGPIWLLAAAIFGVVWNAYGVYQYIGSFAQTKASLMTAGMTASQADLYLSLPAWMSVVFAVGVFGGLAGSIALLMKRSIALPIFTVSVIGYILLFVGDYYYGIFDNIPTQLAILTVVVVVAAALLSITRHASNRSLLA
jgi:hypothetical protein